MAIKFISVLNFFFRNGFSLYCDDNLLIFFSLVFSVVFSFFIKISLSFVFFISIVTGTFFSVFARFSSNCFNSSLDIIKSSIFDIKLLF